MRTNDRWHDEEHLSRKRKRQILGLRMRRKRLRMLLRSFVVLERAHGMQGTIIQPFPFCPKCGCESVQWIDHPVEWPERWEEGYCQRCGFKVWESDNSPYRHVLEFWPETFEEA